MASSGGGGEERARSLMALLILGGCSARSQFFMPLTFLGPLRSSGWCVWGGHKLGRKGSRGVAYAAVGGYGSC